MRNLLIALLTLGLLGLIAGCGQESTSSSDDDSQAIVDEFGGFTPTDEAPAFGDAKITSEMGDDETFEDEVLLSPAVDSVINDSETGAYALRIIWGSLRYDSTITEITDWSGSLSVTRGVEIIRRVIRFEPYQDYILPRTERNLIEWVSLTSVHHDGIFVNIYVPPPDPAAVYAADEPVTVTFDTEPLSVTFDILDLAALDTIFYLDDSVNAVAFRAFKIVPMACPRGFLEGRWGKDSAGQGVFFGRWISIDGALVGHLKGRWGNDLDGSGNNVFVGKYIDLTGKFKGLLKGRYVPYPGRHGSGNAFTDAGGIFYGHFYGAGGDLKGVLRGRYRMPREDSQNDFGFFAGRWRTYCPVSIADQADDGLDG